MPKAKRAPTDQEMLAYVERVRQQPSGEILADLMLTNMRHAEHIASLYQRIAELERSHPRVLADDDSEPPHYLH